MTTTTQVPPPDPKLPDWAEDGKAKAEEKNWIHEEKLRSAKVTTDVWWTKVFGLVVIALMIVFACLFIGGLVAWTSHYLLPEKWQWLTDEQLSKIQSTIFSGSLGGLVSFVAQRQLLK